MCDNHMPKQWFVGMACDSKSHHYMAYYQHEIEYWSDNGRVRNLPNEGKQKQAKTTESYLLWIFCKKTSSYWWSMQKGNCKSINIEVSNKLFAKG